MINIFKKSVCLMLILVIMLCSLSLTSFAADETKTVTYDKAYTFVISSSQLPTYLYSPSSCVPATYYYDDGTYKGTLNLTSASCSSPTPTGNPVGSKLEVTISAKYSGTVIARKTKTVTYDTSYTFLISSPQLPIYLYSPSSCVPTTYYYDDGTYKGTLNLSSATCSSPTPAGDPVGSKLLVTISAKYSGTVFEK
jgi:hypothetical protein